MHADLIVPLNGLSAGKSARNVFVGKEFFLSFGSTEILDAEVSVDISVEKSGTYIGVDLDMDGWVEVTCDRCLSELRLPVSVRPRLSVKFGEHDSAEQELREGEREILFLPESDAELDLSQVVYDYVCISLPLKKAHPEGECDPDTVKYLSVEKEEEVDADSPFASLKELLWK